MTVGESTTRPGPSRSAEVQPDRGERAERRQRVRPGREVEPDQLPVLPAVVVRLMSLSPGSAGLFEDVLAIVSEDPTMAVRVIRVANSPMSAPRSPVDTLPAAVARLGATQVRELVTAVAIARVFVPRTAGETDLWLHAIEVATVARHLAESHRTADVRTDHAYLAGLLHDIGRFVLFDQSPVFIRDVDDLAWDTPAELVAAERQVLGIDHAAIGARVCGHWEVPERISVCVAHHHDPLLEVPQQARLLVALVQVADWLSIQARTHPDHLGVFTNAGQCGAAMEMLGFDTNELSRLLLHMSQARIRATKTLGLIAA